MLGDNTILNVDSMSNVKCKVANVLSTTCRHTFFHVHSVAPSYLLPYCPVFTGPSDCAVGEFACQSGICIPMSKYNNSVNDCQDNSDEGESVVVLDATIVYSNEM